MVDDQEGSPTWARDLSAALEALVRRPAGRVPHGRGGLGHLGRPGRGRLRRRPAWTAASGAITTAELGRPAPRPAFAPLAVTRPGAPRLRPWREALRDYLEETP